MARIFLKPGAGLKIPDPATRQPLPAEGNWVEMSQYWSARLLEDDVADDTAAQQEREAAAEKEADAAAKRAAKSAKTGEA